MPKAEEALAVLQSSKRNGSTGQRSTSQSIADAQMATEWFSTKKKLRNTVVRASPINHTLHANTRGVEVQKDESGTESARLQGTMGAGETEVGTAVETHMMMGGDGGEPS